MHVNHRKLANIEARATRSADIRASTSWIQHIELCPQGSHEREHHSPAARISGSQTSRGLIEDNVWPPIQSILTGQKVRLPRIFHAMVSLPIAPLPVSRRPTYPSTSLASLATRAPVHAQVKLYHTHLATKSNGTRIHLPGRKTPKLNSVSRSAQSTPFSVHLMISRVRISNGEGGDVLLVLSHC